MNVVKHRSIALSACLAVCAAGCGGGSGQGAPSTASTHTAKLGDAVLTYFGQPKPQLTSGAGSVGVVGQAGATFSTVSLQPPPNLADTYLAVSRSIGGNYALYKLPYGGQAQLLYQNGQWGYVPGISAYGEISFSSATGGIFTIRPDGSGYKQLSFSGAGDPFGGQYSVDGTNRICFFGDGSNNLYAAPGTGGAATLLQTNIFGYPGAWSPSGTQIAYGTTVSAGKNVIEATGTTTTGTTPTDVTPPGLQGAGVFTFMTWNADNETIAASYEPAGSSTFETVKFSTNYPNSYTNLTPSGYSDMSPSYSPDGSLIAFYRTSAGGATPGVYISDAEGQNSTLVLPDSSTATSNGGLAWSPFLPKETVVASSASTFYHEACSGFLLSQTNNQFGSFVAFTATTPADAAIQAPAASIGSQPMLFTLTADSISEVGYTNNYFSPGTIVNLTSTPSVVISIDATTGQVDMMAPAATSKASPTKNADGTMTYKCAFKGIYDGTGKNLAPGGASVITVNPKTGKLLSFK